MWDCCFIQAFSYGNQTDDQRATERAISQYAYNALLHIIWDRDRVDLRYTAPREWPRFSYLSEEEVQQVMDTHLSAPLLKAISDYDIKLVQRLLYCTASDLWLSDKDKDRHYPLLITLREKYKELEEQEY